MFKTPNIITNYILEGGRPKTRRYIGLTLLTLTEEILGELPNVPINTKGVLVWKVVVGSPSYMCVRILKVTDSFCIL